MNDAWLEIQETNSVCCFFNGVHVDDSKHFKGIQSTQQGLPYDPNSIMKLESSSGTQTNPEEKIPKCMRKSDKKKPLDYLHINILYCGGVQGRMQYYV